MKKQWLLLCLAAVLLLCGCDNAPADPTETTPSTTAAQVDIRPLPPENPGSSLMEYVPDREIFITGANMLAVCTEIMKANRKC